MGSSGGPVAFAPEVAGKSALAWRSRATTIDGIETELSRIWSQPSLDQVVDGEGTPERHVGARTSVMNLVVVARPDYDPVPAFRELAAGRRLPGDG